MGPNTGILDRLGTPIRIAGAAAVIMLCLVAFAYAIDRPDWGPQPIVGISGAVDQESLEVTVVHGRCPSGDPVVRVDESATEVRIRAEQDVHGDCEDVELHTMIEVDLDQPLADRPLLVEPPREPHETDCAVTGRPDGACVS